MMKLIEWSKHVSIYLSSKNFDKWDLPWLSFGKSIEEKILVFRIIFFLAFRKTFEMQLKFKSKSMKCPLKLVTKVNFFVEDDFKTDYDLQLACLILELQVKLINGNEANLLVPENWMKKYLDDQDKRRQQIASPPSQMPTRGKSIVFRMQIVNVSVSLIAVEPPKVTTSVSTQPKVTQPPGMMISDS